MAITSHAHFVILYEYLLVSVGCADENSVTACSSDVAASLVNDFDCILDLKVYWYCFYNI